MTRSDAIAQLVAQHFSMDEPSGGLPLAVSPIEGEEIAAAIDTLLSGWLTMGKKVLAFEQAWAEAVGTKHAVCVNSGSSALLVMLTALMESGVLSRGQEVIVPAVGWSTSLFTVAQAGLKPVLVDVGADSLCLEGDWDRPVLAVHLLGCPSRATGPVVIEDACGAHGARIGDEMCGSIGVASAFSFFFSHHPHAYLPIGKHHQVSLRQLVNQCGVITGKLLSDCRLSIGAKPKLFTTMTFDQILWQSSQAYFRSC